MTVTKALQVWLTEIVFLHHSYLHIKFAFPFEKLVGGKSLYASEPNTALQQRSNSFLTHLPPVINHESAPNPSSTDKQVETFQQCLVEL